MNVQLPLKGNDLLRFGLWKKRNTDGSEEDFARMCAKKTKNPAPALTLKPDGTFSTVFDKSELRELNNNIFVKSEA